MSHHGQGHGSAEGATVAGGGGEQKLPIAEARFSQQSLVHHGREEGAQAAVAPALPELRLAAAEEEPDPLIIGIAGIDSSEYMTIALEQAGGVHARQEIQFTISVVAAPGIQNPALAPQAAEELGAGHGLEQAGSVASFKCRQVCRRASVVRSQAANSKRLSMN